jgi:hypothetical protein
MVEILSMPLLYLLALIAVGPTPQGQSSSSRASECREWRQCQQLALEARERGDYEKFHDLAWRTVQTGPARDPMLMYLLARAQSLSGRPHDALVMLNRLSDMSVPTDAATNDDFSAVRTLREWTQLEARLTPGAPPASPAPAGRASTPPPAASNATARAATNPGLFKAEDALSLSAALEPAGLAYDGVSGRFVVGDRRERKLVVLDERSHHAIDLVRAASAGFYQITAIEIDTRRGDLWVVSADQSNNGASPATALNRLQLVSGRPIDMVPVPDNLKPARLDDVAVTTDGVVFVLDTLGKRILRLDSKTKNFAVVAALSFDGPTSIAPADDRTIFVAHASGIARVDSSTGAASPVREPTDVSLSGFKHIRRGPSSLVGIQQMPDGTRRAVSIRLNGGRAVGLDVVEPDLPRTDPPVATLSSGDFYFLTRRPPQDGKEGEIVVKRIRLR